MKAARRSRSKRIFGILGASTFLSTLVMPATAWAEDAAKPATSAAEDNEGDGLKDIVVTATRKSESIQKVPISIQALSPAKLEDHQVTGFTDYVNMLPSVSFSTLGPGRSNVYFRGISVGGGSLPTTGTYLDDVPISTAGRMPDLHIYDIERVEALSGPQGTLFGASSLAGTLRIITNKADTSGFKAGYDLTVDKYGKGDPGAMIEGFINVPISQDVAIRLMGYYDHEGGYIDNKPAKYTFALGDNDPTTNYTIDSTNVARDNYNPVSDYGGRLNMTIKLDDNWTILPSITAQYLNAEGGFNYDPRLGDLTVHDFSKTYNIDKWAQAALTIQGKIADFDVVSSTGYFKRKILNANDYTYYSVTYDKLGPGYENYLKFYDKNGSLINPTQQYLGRISQTKFTQEVRVSVPKSWPFDLTIGGFYQFQKSSSDSDYYIPGLSQIDLVKSGVGPHLASDGVTMLPGFSFNPAIKRDAFYLVETDTKFKDYAAFAEGSFEPLNGLKITGGIRYFKANNTVYGFSGVATASRAKTCTIPFPDQRFSCVNTDIKFKGSGETHKVSAAWEIDSSKMVYATYSTGFRPGGGNRIAPNNPYQADTLTNYEVGFKTTWGNNFRLNGAFYYEVWDGVQYGVVPFGFQGAGVTLNAGKARVYGTEMDFDWKLGGLTLSGSGAYNDAALSEDFCKLDPVLRVAQLASCPLPAQIAAAKGTRLPRQPRFKGQFSARYEMPMGSFKSFAQGTMYAQTNSTSDLDVYKNSLLGNTAGFVSFDFSAGVKKDDWTATFFIQNIFDRRGELSKNTFCSIEYCASSSRTFSIKPQYFGLKFSRRY